MSAGQGTERERGRGIVCARQIEAVMDMVHRCVLSPSRVMCALPRKASRPPNHTDQRDVIFGHGWRHCPAASHSLLHSQDRTSHDFILCY